MCSRCFLTVGTVIERMEAIPAHLLNYRLYLLDPPVHQMAREVWYQSKITEIFPHLFFQPEAPAELFARDTGV
jgi:hypothetical protein